MKETIMKKIAFITTLASACFVGSASAQTLVAAWAFNYPNAFGGLDFDGDFQPDSSAPATCGDTEATFTYSGMGSGGGLSNAGDLDANQNLRPLQIASMNDGFGWLVDANSSQSATFEISMDLSAFDGGTAELTFAAGSQNGPVTLLVSAGSSSQEIALSAGADALQTIDISSLAGSASASVSFSFADFEGTDNAAIDNIQVVAEAGASQGGGSLFILDNESSSAIPDQENWYETPMGSIFAGAAPWLWSPNYGWHFSPESNTSELAYVYILAAPFQTWVYVDQAQASEQGFWGYAFDAENAALNGWFFFFNPQSTEDQNEYFIWDSDGQQTLTFTDRSATAQ